MVVKSAFYTTIGKDSPQAALDREPSRRALFPQPMRRIPKIPHLAVLARGAAPPRSLGGDAMSTVDPLESINRQLSEALIKALDAPMRAFVTRNQEALQRSLAAPRRSPSLPDSRTRPPHAGAADRPPHRAEPAQGPRPPENMA
jgi:hypothetical protein